MNGFVVHGDTGERDVVVGLEVGAQFASNTKLFSIEQRAGFVARPERWW
ncbi:MAG: hypothetical protein ACRCS5_06085 [Sphingomonas sp.]